MKTFQFKSQYGNYNVYIKKGEYSNHRIALQLVDAEDGLTILKATVNMPIENVEKNQVIIKDYAENKGVFSFLIENNIVSKAKDVFKCGYNVAYLCDFYPENI